MPGYVDKFGDFIFSGWVWNGEAENQGVALLVNDEFIRVLPADNPRDDVRMAGFGDGLCGFDYQLPSEIFAEGSYSITFADGFSGKALEGGRFVVEDGVLSPAANQAIDQPFTPLSVQNLFKLYYHVEEEYALSRCVNRVMIAFSHLSPAEFLTLCYYLIFVRHPDPEGYQSNLMELQNEHISYRGTVLKMLESGEFRSTQQISSVNERVRKLKLPALLQAKARNANAAVTKSEREMLFSETEGIP